MDIHIKQTRRHGLDVCQAFLGDRLITEALSAWGLRVQVTALYKKTKKTNVYEWSHN